MSSVVPEKIAEALKEISIDAVWVGEDGSMVCVAPRKRRALTMFRALTRLDVGDLEARDLKEDEISIGYLHLVEDLPEEDRHEGLEDCEWYVTKLKKSPYKVWYYDV